MENKLYQEYSLNLFNEQTRVNVFITKAMNSDELDGEWQRIRNDVALRFQRRVKNDFERWNFYIFYVVEGADKMDINLKYRIEHDMYSSRKIVVDSMTIGDDKVKYVVDKYIKYDIVENMEESHELSKFTRNEELCPIINEILTDEKD